MCTLIIALLLFLLNLNACTPHSRNIAKEEGLYRGRIIDAHAHYSEDKIELAKLIKLLNQSEVSQVVLLAGEEELRSAVNQYPDRVIPFLSPYAVYRKNGRIKIPQTSLSSINKSLGTGFFRGYGEILLRLHPIKPFAPQGAHVPADDPVMLQIYNMAASYNIPVIVHVDANFSDELERALPYNRNTKIIWAHSGYADHSQIRSMFERHPNLYADLSVLADPYKKHHVQITSFKAKLKHEWKDLFEDYSDRLMLGSDMGGSMARYMATPKVINHYRRLLYQLNPEAAENIAYKTILSLISIPEGGL